MALTPRQKATLWQAYQQARSDKKPEEILFELFGLLLDTKETQKATLRALLQASRDADVTALTRTDQEKLDREAALNDSITTKDTILTGSDL